MTAPVPATNPPATELTGTDRPATDAPVALDPAARYAPDPARAILRVTGPDRIAFLQGMVTQDVNRLPDHGILYAALLTPQGKYLADFFLVAADAAVLVDVAGDLADDLQRRLTMYKLRSKITLERVDLPVTRGIGPAPEGALPDPRDPSLGWRLYGAALNQGEAPDWDALRIAARVPETGRELQPNESFILELGFERLNGVDFRKGCYVGQEVTARMRHKTTLRKGLVRVRLDGPAESGTELLTEDGKPAGTLHTVAGDRGLAWLRFDRAAGGLTAGAARVTADLDSVAGG
ncbi:folate-binding protein YgfZ [Pararhodobacter sp. SW119]|uniref:CAF17-like 4Fe-4S cluster assembly/insertion protein YgfZ n=1 Tax=Pararhodobacter sp. SW119 TaxID=2780075 RepID=UPI001ADF5381|nr:folate-binding protein YgfZ [Pararhodobacter sp. SW119]